MCVASLKSHANPLYIVQDSCTVWSFAPCDRLRL
jgi:hypothetical protein